MRAHYLLITAIAAPCFTACKKSDSKPAPNPTATLTVIMRHHGSTSVIDSANFYIAPLRMYTASGSGFTAQARGIKLDGVTFGSFAGLGSDSLYIYGRAYDTALHTHIDGGVKHTLSAPSHDTVYLDMADTTGTYPIYLVVF